MSQMEAYTIAFFAQGFFSKKKLTLFKAFQELFFLRSFCCQTQKKIKIVMSGKT